ncbi:hypothetical protein AVEN_76571-1 [Araneus ventricosus]|uniref:Uncharacterized protein n=1 Tax=Araneus ventricosus TaxID=182803 RepID=A0A4Y2R9G1_ARAVE|nr:hypothetical protein AVEN_76571-1 [Araneus ventricosus]
MAKRPPAGVAWKFGEGVPAQVSSSSSDRDSKLRGPSQNSPRVASKRDVNITKTKLREILTRIAHLCPNLFHVVYERSAYKPISDEWCGN